MPHYSDYRCSKCKRVTERSLLVAKKVVFAPLGPGTKSLRSRTVAWLCDECLPKDEDYNRPSFRGAPGMQSVPLEEVRAAEARIGTLAS